MESIAADGVAGGMGRLLEEGGARYALPRDEDIDEFLSKVNDVTEKVQNILSGKITVEEMQQEEKKLLLKEKVRQMREAEKKEEEHKRYIMGTRGTGTKDSNYKYFCSHCLVEFKYVLSNCPRCSGGVVTKEERLRDLQEKVNQYKEKKKKRDARRASWKKWQSEINRKGETSRVGTGNSDEENGPTNEAGIANTITDYDKWNHYEPSSDTFDEDEKITYVPKHNKDFNLLEQKLQSDIDTKNQHRKVAYSIKLRGNEFFKKKKYVQAIECYEEALQVCKDYLEVYNNVALCYLKTYRYDLAIDRCNEVIQYYDVFKEDFRLKKDTLFKSHLRKGLAWYRLFHFEEALTSFKSALEFSPGDVEASAYVEKCERMVRRDTPSGGTVPPNGISPLPRRNNSNVKEDTMDLSHTLSELAKMDLTKDGKIFWETLKGVKKSLKRSEEAKLAFYSDVHSIEHSKGGTSSGMANRKGRTTFLSFCADKLEEVLLYVKRAQRREEAAVHGKSQQVEGGKLPRYTSLSAILLIDLITLILEWDHRCADFCLSAVNPLITLYQLKRIKKVKAARFFNSIGRDTEGRKLLHERIIQQEEHTLMGMLLTRIGHLIAEERSLYTEEQRTRLLYLTECIEKLESVRRYEVDLRGVIPQGGKTHGGEPPTTRWTQKSRTGRGRDTPESKTNSGSDTPTERDPWKELQERTARMYKHKFELANLFGIISHLTLKQEGRDVLEKEFTRDILNIIIYTNELFYSCQGMNCNCLSVLVNLVGSPRIRDIIMSASWPHMLHFVESFSHEERQLDSSPNRENPLENVLSLLFNLTCTWKEQIREGDGASSPPRKKTLIREGALRQMIFFTRSDNIRVAELSCFILSRLYTYAYCGVVEIDQGKSVPLPLGTEERRCKNDHYVPSTQEDTSNEDRNGQLVHSLKRKIEKENDQQIHLDEYSFDWMKRSILSELDSPRGGGLTSACINLLCCLSKYTDFLARLLYGEESNLERLTNRLVSLFVENKSNLQGDNSTSIMVKNIAAFFTQMIKILTVREATNRGSASVVKSIERVIPHAAELVNNGMCSGATSKGISFFLSYCFVYPPLKPAVLAAFHDDVGRLGAVLRSGNG
ncbi:hypothetical protein C922_03897 [Plasmodium inui San Antonio 1]|uniref:Uncharacterized protein n=1 Tax=Plasmodium inui San Antonio 1 TaxID=1237626 RepID=W7A943_9APIC|nr:hypothetical protein C922_03897 [Plasmodium inui San Antonio 1]EUD65649.1 hypothetical protein C922_03897 [Plasmodium inui San Antonio 1]